MGTALTNLTRSPFKDSDPVFSADGREILFARDEVGQSRILRMSRDGGQQRRVTTATGFEMFPAVSPDGVSLAFSGDRRARGLDILRLDLRRPDGEVVVAARRSHESRPAFSPDGRQLAFEATSDGNSEIYVVNTDGTGLTRLTHDPAEDVEPQFSADGRHLVFAGNRTGRYAIHRIALR